MGDLWGKVMRGACGSVQGGLVVGYAF